MSENIAKLRLLAQELIPFDNFNIEDFIAAQFQPPNYTIRVNKHSNKLSLLSTIIESQVPWCPSAYYLQQKISFNRDPFWHVGVYYVQEAASLFLDYLIKQLPMNHLAGNFVLDACAAPGGKTQILAQNLPYSAIIANEKSFSRIHSLIENSIKGGFDNILITQNKIADWQKTTFYFDLILLDAPCSGSGLFRKIPSYLNKWTPTMPLHCANIQQQLVKQLLPLLKTNAYFIYSTCSFSMEENEKIIDYISSQFNLEVLEFYIPKNWGIIKTYLKNRFMGYRFFPQILKSEGFFISVLRNNQNPVAERTTNPKGFISKKAQFQPPILNEIPQLSNFELIQFLDSIRITNETVKEVFYNIPKGIVLKSVGLNLGKFSKNLWLPAHDILMKEWPLLDIPTIELNLAESLSYLKKEIVKSNFLYQGWTIAQFEEVNLGWLKGVADGYKNYYPLNWRLRN